MAELIHIPCPQCNILNRIPRSRLLDTAVCGKCKEPLFQQQPLELTSENFQKQILKSEIPVVVDFWAPWCGPCTMMAPAFHQAASQLEPHFRLAKLNTEKEQAIAAQYGIRSIPTLVIFRNGQEIARQSGAMGKEDIIRWIRSQG